MSAFAAILSKELKAVMKERTIILAVLIQLVIASLSSLFLGGLIAFYSPGDSPAAHVNVGIVGDTRSPLAGFINSKSSSSAWAFDSPEDALEAYKAGRLDAILYIPEGADASKNLMLYLPSSNSKASIILMILKAPLTEYEKQVRANDGIHTVSIKAPGKPDTSYEFLYTLIIPLLMFFPAFIAGSMVIDTLSEEFEGHTLDTLLSSPVSFEGMLAAKMGAAVLVASAQCVIWPLLLLLNGIAVENMAWVVLLGVAAAMLAVAGSVLVTALFKDRERSQLVYSFMLMAMIGGAYFIRPSPFNLLARLAMGDVYAEAWNVAVYLLLAIFLLALTLYAARRLKPIKV